MMQITQIRLKNPENLRNLRIKTASKFITNKVYYATMNKHAFTLIPFPTMNIPQITIAGNISRRNNVVTVHYALTGSVEAVVFPLTLAHASRMDELWKFTCFEFFLAIKDQSDYWEFNMSPSGDWNVYHMDAYRRDGFREEISIVELPFTMQLETDCFSLDVAVDLNTIIEQGQTLDVGITAIIQTQDGNETYWALAHPGSHADFHLRESFILELAPSCEVP